MCLSRIRYLGKETGTCSNYISRILNEFNDFFKKKQQNGGQQSAVGGQYLACNTISKNLYGINRL